MSFLSFSVISWIVEFRTGSDSDGMLKTSSPNNGNSVIIVVCRLPSRSGFRKVMPSDPTVCEKPPHEPPK